MNRNQVRKQVATALRASQSKQAENIAIIEMEESSSAFTDYFLICHGTNPRQVKAIADAVEDQLKLAGTRPNDIEGYKEAEWVLLDYVDFVVHVFSEQARKFYDLERLWKTANRLDPATLAAPVRARKSASRSADRLAGIRPARSSRPARRAKSAGRARPASKKPGKSRTGAKKKKKKKLS